MADDRSVSLRIPSSDEVSLDARLARPPGIARVHGVVVCHGFPHGPGGGVIVGRTYPDLGEWLSRQTGWGVLTFNFRGTGESTGNFSARGWLDDVEAAVSHLDARDDVDGVGLVGTATGGVLALVHAARDDRVRAVATLAAPASLRSWVDNVPRFLDHVHRLGVVRDEGFPPDLMAWAREIAELDPVAAAAKIPPRPLLVLHGADDDVVPSSDSELLAGAAGPGVEHRILAGAGHRLRHDPRVCALLAGWMSRQD